MFGSFICGIDAEVHKMNTLRTTANTCYVLCISHIFVFTDIPAMVLWVTVEVNRFTWTKLTHLTVSLYVILFKNQIGKESA